MRPNAARRAREPSRASEASRYVRDLLNRYAAAKAGRRITPELEAEMKALGEAFERRRARTRGEGHS